MAFLGNTPSQQAFTPAVDYFNGTGSATAFTLSRPVASVAQVQVTIENVPQNPSSAFTVSGSTITFTSAPPSGTSNVYVTYTSPITQVIAPGQGTVNTTQLGSVRFNNNYTKWVSNINATNHYRNNSHSRQGNCIVNHIRFIRKNHGSGKYIKSHINLR